MVHGHHQFANGPVLLNHRTDLDTFAWATGRLAIGVFDDDVAGGPVEIIEARVVPTRFCVAKQEKLFLQFGSGQGMSA